MKNIILIIIFISLLSCNKSDNSTELITSDLRNELLKEADIKLAFSKLDVSEKIIVWESKLNQLSNLKLPKKHLELINNLKDELVSHSEESHKALFSYALELAKITPKEDFIDMFSSLEDYKYNDEFYGSEISNEIINDLANTENTVNKWSKTNNTSSNKSQRTVDACNCKWTCGLYSSSHSDCEETTSGCGFLWLSACTGAVM